ncbi:hypothetical protein [Amycolatopsis sp. NPDC001319]|uniref:hypothetical protein n=1 Tax=unclassified Amycolatopsis TaxID=2618356 RepID=UPI00368CBAE1
MWRWLAPVLVLALAAGVGLAFVVGGAVHSDAVRRHQAAPSGERGGCTAVQLAFDKDDEMQLAAQALQDDPDVAEVFTETRAQTYARLKEVFKDDPDLRQAMGPEDVPPMITAFGRPGTDATALAAKLRQRTLGAGGVNPLTQDQVREYFPPGTRAPSCP